MTFLKLTSYIKDKYKFNNQEIIWQIIYKLSKLVKNNISFTKYRNHEIDFNINLFEKYISDYLNKNKPIELITNKVRFYGLNFKVFKGVLIPRPDTEVLCEKVIKILSKDKKLKHGVDLCCGSGNIAITLKKKIKHIKMDAIDIQTIACKNAKLNAQYHKIKLNVIKGDFYKTLINKHLKYDFVVCNPPYVNKKELDKTMLKYENKINFSNSKDHLFFYKKIIDNYQRIVNNRKHFLLAFEIGFNQKKDLKKYLSTKRLHNNSMFYKDYNKKDRVLIIYKN